MIAYFLSPNLLEVKNVVADYLAIESWEKVKTWKKYMDSSGMLSISLIARCP